MSETMIAGSKPRQLTARPDTIDFRDIVYEATLIEVPVKYDLTQYTQHAIPILDQGTEGACTGFALATVANYLLKKRADQQGVSTYTKVSPYMLYEMARKYDEWPGENYEGSSARGAVKGWHKHGVCAEQFWSAGARQPGELLAEDAMTRPLGAYLRINHNDLVAMHCALTEVGILYASAAVHDGWQEVGQDGIIHYSTEVNILGGHAFAIVAYDEEGFWIQNSWGDDWGAEGFARISYSDWLSNGSDVWAVRLGVPMRGHILSPNRSSIYISSSSPIGELRPHFISIGNDGELRHFGKYGTTEADIERIFNEDFPRIRQEKSIKHLLLYAHGGLVSEDLAIRWLMEQVPTMLNQGVYPLAFIWKTDFWSTLDNIFNDAVDNLHIAGWGDRVKDFLFDRLDNSLEPLVRKLAGKAMWDEMKENALLSSISPNGGARVAARYVANLVSQFPDVKIHVVGHSAGGVFLAPFLQLLASRNIEAGPLQGEQGHDIPVETSILWAPACSVHLFTQTYLPLIEQKLIRRFVVHTLTDEAEQDDSCLNIYHKSILYLVSNALEEQAHIPRIQEGTALLGMANFIQRDTSLKNLFNGDNRIWIQCPSSDPDHKFSSLASHHGDFDNDPATLRAALAWITGV